MATNVKQSGSVLLLALIFCAASSLCLLLIFETSILETAMARHYHQKKQIFLEYLEKLHHLEVALEDKRFVELPHGVTIKQWVPDTLACNDPEGVLYYQISEEITLPDGASSQFTSIFVVRGPMPAGIAHPNAKYCGKEYQSIIIPLSNRLPISALYGEVIIGIQPDGGGTLLYALAKKKYQSGQVLLIVRVVEGEIPEILKVIDTGTHLYPPILRNHQLIINDDDWVMQFDAYTGEMRHKEKVQPSSYFAPLTENSKPIMQVRKPREAKRLILCPTSRGWAQAEIDVDYEDLGRRTWHEA